MEGVGWRLIGTAAVSLPSTVLVGLPVTSHFNSTLTTSTFDGVSLTQP